MQCPLGAPRGPPNQGPELQGCPGSLQGSQGQMQPETALVWDQCPGRHPPKTHRPLTSHQLPQTCSIPSGGPNSERAPPETVPHAPPLSHGKPYQIPTLGAKPSLGGELGRGEARGKRRGLLLALALCSLASRATHPPQSHTSDGLSNALFCHCSVPKSYLTLWDPIHCGRPGFPVILAPTLGPHAVACFQALTHLFPGLQCPALSFLLGELFILQHPAPMYPSQ